MEPKRQLGYIKDSSDEAKLESLNTHLFPLEKVLIKSFNKPKLPVVFIVGAPRSGTTLLHQLLTKTNSFSYISNFVARFWLAPYVGMMIQDALKFDEGNFKAAHPSFISDMGRTNGLIEPHEFGYFWSRWFEFGNSHKLAPEALNRVDKLLLVREVSAMESVLKKPVLFKNLTCSLQIEFLIKVFPNSFFVFCNRNPLYNAQSLLIARSKVLGSKKEWLSLKPSNYSEIKKLPYCQQVMAQVYSTLEDIREGLLSVPQNQIIDIKYENICSNPKSSVRSILRSIGLMEIRKEGEVGIMSHIPEYFVCQNYQKTSNKDFLELCQAKKSYFPG